MCLLVGVSIHCTHVGESVRIHKHDMCMYIYTNIEIHRHTIEKDVRVLVCVVIHVDDSLCKYIHVNMCVYIVIYMNICLYTDMNIV